MKKCNCCKKTDTFKNKVKVLIEVLLVKTSRDINNNNTSTYTAIGNVWGTFSNMSPYYKENIQSTYNKEITHTILCVYLKELDTKKYLRYDNKIFEIIEIMNIDELSQYMKLYCKIREQN